MQNTDASRREDLKRTVEVKLEYTVYDQGDKIVAYYEGHKVDDEVGERIASAIKKNVKLWRCDKCKSDYSYPMYWSGGHWCASCNTCPECGRGRFFMT